MLSHLKIPNKRNFVTHFTERLLPTDYWSMHCKLAYYYVFWPRPRDMLEVAAWCIFILEEGSLNSKEEVTGPRNANIVSRRMHSGRNQGFLSNGCIGCIYLVKILAHYAMLQCMSRYNKPPWVALTTTASLTITIKLGAIKYFLSIIQKYL